MAIYKVTANQAVFGKGTRDGRKELVIAADSAAIAKRVAAAQFDQDGAWSDATALECSAASDVEGWTYRIRVSAASSANPDVVDVSYVAKAGDDVDDVGDALVILLNATAPIAGAAYSTPMLKIAETSDALGARKVCIQAFAPDAVEPVVDMIGTVVDGGATGATLTAILTIPTDIPTIF
jgi:hypothetical protein